MDGPGEYLPDVTEGITRVEDLPKAKVVGRSRNYRRRPCPECGHSAYRDRVVRRTLHDLGDLKADRPVDVKVTYSQHYCSPCGIYFNADMDDLALPKVHYTHRVVAMNEAFADIARCRKRCTVCEPECRSADGSPLTCCAAYKPKGEHKQRSRYTTRGTATHEPGNVATDS